MTDVAPEGMKAAFGMAITDPPCNDMDRKARRHEKAFYGVDPQCDQMLSRRGIHMGAMLPAKRAFGQADQRGDVAKAADILQPVCRQLPGELNRVGGRSFGLNTFKQVEDCAKKPDPDPIGRALGRIGLRQFDHSLKRACLSAACDAQGRMFTIACPAEMRDGCGYPPLPRYPVEDGVGRDPHAGWRDKVEPASALKPKPYSAAVDPKDVMMRPYRRTDPCFRLKIPVGLAQNA